MEEAAAVRRAASEATADIEPREFREVIDDYVDSGSMVPGVVALLGARMVDADDVDTTGCAEPAAGVQLIYDGLRLTRHLAQTDPWDADVARPDTIDPDMAILGADVLVARGFYLLARTAAAEEAVRVVQAFGRDQTIREGVTDETAATALDRNLEVDAIKLALLVGTATAAEADADLGALASDLVDGISSFPPAEEYLTAARRDRLAALGAGDGKALNRND
ncbi:MAG: hypothetical protein PPP58_05255 [Natronomonas sp.]